MLGALKTHRYIGNIVISKIVISGFCPIHFTVTFAGHSISIVIPGISLYRGSLYRGSTVPILLHQNELFHTTFIHKNCPG